MSIVAKVAKFTIRAILSSLAKEAAKCERKVQYAVAKRDSKVATLDKEIIAQSKREDSEIAKLTEKYNAQVKAIKDVKTRKMNRKMSLKHDIRWNCGAECRHLNKKGQDALALKAKLEAVLK